MHDHRLKPDPSWNALSLPENCPPILVVVIDTEEEFDWEADFNRNSVSTNNIQHQSLAQSIMDDYGVVPTYVIDYPVANTPESIEILRTIREDGRCEIGLHLHPWVNPPHKESVNEFHSYPGNLPLTLERQKIMALTRKIEDGFEFTPTIYKAGRYGVGPNTYKILQELNYKIDTSVVPYADFTRHKGPDFRGFPSQPFMINDDLIALPHSVHFIGTFSHKGETIYPYLTSKIGHRLRARGIASRLRLLERLRLTPEGYTFEDMKRQTLWALARGHKYFMMTYHSSTLLPGANTYVKNTSQRDEFLKTLSDYLHFFTSEVGGKPVSVTDVTKMYFLQSNLD